MSLKSITVAFGIAVPRIFQYYNHSLLYNSKYNILDSVFHSLFLYSAIALQHTRREARHARAHHQHHFLFIPASYSDTPAPHPNKSLTQTEKSTQYKATEFNSIHSNSDTVEAFGDDRTKKSIGGNIIKSIVYIEMFHCEIVCSVCVCMCGLIWKWRKKLPSYSENRTWYGLLTIHKSRMTWQLGKG